MKAFFLVKQGSTLNLKMGGIDAAQIVDDEMLVEVKLITINPVATITRPHWVIYPYGLSVKSVSGKHLVVQSSGIDIDYSAGILKSGKLKCHISKSFFFNQMADVYVQIKAGKTAGKIRGNV